MTQSSCLVECIFDGNGRIRGHKLTGENGPYRTFSGLRAEGRNGRKGRHEPICENEPLRTFDEVHIWHTDLAKSDTTAISALLTSSAIRTCS